jgi:sugar lactone lactonase YvrE
MPDGDVKPCCGYATDRKELTIGNIKFDSATAIMKNFRKNKFVHAVFNRGLKGIRIRLERSGVRFPGRTGSHCYFCNYILTKVPRRILVGSLTAILALFLFISGRAFAQDIRIGKDCPEIRSVVVKKVSIPRWYHEGLFFDGGILWLANGEKGNIWVIDAATGEVTSRMEPVGDFPEALIRADDGGLLTTEWYAKKVYRVKLDGVQLVPEAESSLGPALPAGIASAGDRLFVITWTRGIGTKFHLVEMDLNLNVINRMLIRDMQEPCQLAWDGEDLWVSSWYVRKIYRVNIDRWEITGYIRSPVSKTTGIAWDGKHMWVTGTYSDLYQMEITK